MNKTVTVNIGGMVFHIEEHAYEKLKKYLEAIRGYFTTSDGRDEIIQDIESRIAEMFTERIGTSRQVVTEADVEFMIDTMGRPEQVAGEDTEFDNKNSYSGANSGAGFSGNTDGGYRRLYRDPENKVVGGVCSGISHYIGIDPIWMRLIFGIAFFVYGSGFLLYLLLLIIIPKAKTTAEKLEMKGQPVNIDNIKRTIEDEVNDIKSRLSGNGPLSNGRNRGTNSVSRFFDALGQILTGVFKIALKVVGGIFMVILSVILIGLFVSVLVFTGIIGDAHIPIFMTKVFLEGYQLNLAILTLVIIVGVPVIMLLFKIVRTLFNIKAESKILNYTSSIIWAIGVILAIYLGVSISKNFRVSEQQRVTIPIVQPAGNTLYLQQLNPRSSRDETYYNNTIEIDDGFSVDENGDTVRVDKVKLDIIKSDNDQFELVKIVNGKGSTRKEAEYNTRGISYDLAQEDSVIKFSDTYLLPKNVRFRNQKIQLILKVPVGKSVYLNDDIDNVIYDVQNVTNTYDGDMVGHTWTMTDKGLECLGCNLSQEKDHSGEHVRVRVNGEDVDVKQIYKNGKVKVRVNGEDVDVKTDDDTINWDNKDVKIRINSDGVVIDAKEKK